MSIVCNSQLFRRSRDDLTMVLAFECDSRTGLSISNSWTSFESFDLKKRMSIYVNPGTGHAVWCASRGHL